MNRLREIRERLGVSKWRLSRDTGLNWKTVHRIESQDRGTYESTKEKIAGALGVSVEDIFTCSDIKCIFVVEPRKVGFEKHKTNSSTGDIVGFVLDTRLRRCAGLKVHLMMGKLKLATSESEKYGRFVFRNVPIGDYTLVCKRIKQPVSV